MIPVWIQLTHRWMQFSVSFVAGVMLGIGVLHMLPHAIIEAANALAIAAETSPGGAAATLGSVVAETVRWISISLLAGMLSMFFIERFFSYHHHDVPDDAEPEPGHHERVHHHEVHVHPDHDLSWSGAALGLALHSVLNGIALAAAVQHGSHGSWLAGFGTFLVIFLHKPFDAMTISLLMGRGGWSLPWRNAINGLFSLCIPIGVLIFYFGLTTETAGPGTFTRQWYIACALAFSAGTFLCISLSDLLPELQFHSHDRLKLSAALLLGLVVAHFAAQMEALAHTPHTPPPAVGETARGACLIRWPPAGFAGFA